jgi:peptide deformylase
MAEARQISQLGDPVLRQTAEPVYNFREPAIQTLIDDLITTLHQSNGVGLAAPQINVSKQVLIVASHPNTRYPNAPEMEPTAMMNPRLVDHSNEVVKDWEGCLSIPGIRGLVPRYKAIEVEYTDREGRLQRQEWSGFVARVFQHELDHLEGLVFLDRLESVKDIITDQEYLIRVVMSGASGPGSAFNSKN